MFLLGLFQMAAGGLLLSVAARLKGLGLMGSGLLVVGLTGILHRALTVVFLVAKGRFVKDESSLDVLYLGLSFLAWTLVVFGAAILVGDLRTRSSQ